MEFFDTHSHLNLFPDSQNLDNVIQRSLDAGVTKIVIPGIDLSTSQKAVEIANHFPSVFAAVGIHPHESFNISIDDIKEIEKLASDKKVVAIGEIGLDYHHQPFDKAQQIKVLQSMLAISSVFNKPFILHSRDSIDDLIEIISGLGFTNNARNSNRARFSGVFHSFEGNLQEALQIIGLNFLIGIGGPITFKNNMKHQEFLKMIGKDSIVLETDAPFLSPHPFRGQKNEPCRIPIIAQKVADLLETTVELIAETTTKNANKLFSMD